MHTRPPTRSASADRASPEWEAEPKLAQARYARPLNASGCMRRGPVLLP